MNANNIKSGLDQLNRSFHKILEANASIVIQQAKGQIDDTKRIFDERTRRTDDPSLIPQPWGYRIHPEQPLTFIVAEPKKGFDAQVDVSCTILWKTEGESPVKQEILLRIWNHSRAYRSEWDHETVLEKMCAVNGEARGRVMLRCHFDLANPNQPGPRFHLQFGGNSKEDELSWFPEIIDLPRFIYPPMDLILVCELVAASFFPETYFQHIKKDSQWKNVLNTSQEHLLQLYFQQCVAAIAGGRSLLDALWNG